MLRCWTGRTESACRQHISSFVSMSGTPGTLCAPQALRRNPYAPAVPCHRVIAASLELGGFSGQWGLQTPNVCKKRALLEKEGVLFDARGKLVDESQCLGAEELGRACRAAGCEA